MYSGYDSLDNGSNGNKNNTNIGLIVGLAIGLSVVAAAVVWFAWSSYQSSGVEKVFESKSSDLGGEIEFGLYGTRSSNPLHKDKSDINLRDNYL